MALSELQIALIVIGVVVVAAVWIFNVVQERRYRRSAEALFKGTQGDALLGDTRGGTPGEADQHVPSSPVGYERTEPVLAATDELDEFEPPDSVLTAPESTDAVPAETSEAEAPVDALVECVVRFALGEGVTFPAMREASRVWGEPLSKPVRWLACDTDGAWLETGSDEAARYSRWVASLQLVDRRGAVSAAEVGAFVDGMGMLVAGLNGDVVVPEAAEVLRQAEALDAFCASVDIQFGINVVEARGGTFPATKLRGFCESSGLLLQEDGRYHATDPGGNESFAISDIAGAALDAESLRTSALHGVTFTLDVPRVANGAREFERMLALAQQFAKAVDGVLVDAQRQPLAEAMIGMIRAKIAELQQRMQDADIPAGGARARKLFA